MRKFGFVIMFLLFTVSVCFAGGIVEIGGGKVDSSGFSYIPITKTDTNANDASTETNETDTEVWAPTSGKKIVLMGGLFTSAVATTVAIESGVIAVGPPFECTASGQIVVGNGTPIWQGSDDATLTYTTTGAGRHSILLWGYEID